MNSSAIQLDPSTFRSQVRTYDNLNETQAHSIQYQLDAMARVITTCNDPNLPSEFYSSLQYFLDGDWLTIAAYQIKRGRAKRYTYQCNGDRVPMTIDLPFSVVMELAWEDFMRNWPRYCTEFAAKMPSTKF